mgnify:CR=1 FL=1
MTNNEINNGESTTIQTMLKKCEFCNGSGILIYDVVITDFTKRGLFQEVGAITTDCYFAIIDFQLSRPRLTR